MKPASPLLRSHFRHLENLRVRWSEIDMQQIVFNGHYLMYFDTAVAGYWRALALPYPATMAALGGDFYVRKATVEYEASAQYDDQLDVGIRCARIGNSSVLLQAAVFRGGQRLVHGELVYVFADPASQAARVVPLELREWLRAFEAGEPMVTLRFGGWAAQREQARALRDAVFVRELGVAATQGDDAADALALHALAVNRLGIALATARLTQSAPGKSRIERVAVQAAMRGSRIGRALLDALIGAARERGDHELVVLAQAAAVGFYRRSGFAATGPAFDVAGIEHREMMLTLR